MYKYRARASHHSLVVLHSLSSVCVGAEADVDDDVVAGDSAADEKAKPTDGGVAEYPAAIPIASDLASDIGREDASSHSDDNAAGDSVPTDVRTPALPQFT